MDTTCYPFRRIPVDVLVLPLVRMLDSWPCWTIAVLKSSGSGTFLAFRYKVSWFTSLLSKVSNYSQVYSKQVGYFVCVQNRFQMVGIWTAIGPCLRNSLCLHLDTRWYYRNWFKYVSIWYCYSSTSWKDWVELYEPPFDDLWSWNWLSLSDEIRTRLV